MNINEDFQGMKGCLETKIRTKSCREMGPKDTNRTHIFASFSVM